jgi:hypothetical protein
LLCSIFKENYIMKNDSYKNIAKVWDWDGYDNTPEYEYWRAYAGRYGKRCLFPCAPWG